MKESISSFTPLKKAVSTFFSDKVDIQDIREKAKQVGIIESEVDKEEWAIARDIFNTELDYGHKIHLTRCLESIVKVSDRAEDAADALEIMIIKGGV